MEDVEATRYFIDISKNLGQINSNIESLCQTIERHEERIRNLENSSIKENKDEDFKTELLKLLGKCLIIGLTAIASLTGVSGLLQQIWK